MFVFSFEGRKEVIMSVKDFYNAVVPWSTITHGVGRGTYTLLSKEEVSSAETYTNEKLPPKPDGRPCLLNEVMYCYIKHEYARFFIQKCIILTHF